MARLVNTEVAFRFDRRFPLTLLVFEAAAADAVNVIRFKIRRLVQCRNLLSGRIVVLFILAGRSGHQSR